MDFTKPDPEKIGKKPPSKLTELIEKIGAGIGLLQLGGGAVMPKISNTVITVFLLIIIFIFGMGIFSTFYWAIKLIQYIF